MVTHSPTREVSRNQTVESFKIKVPKKTLDDLHDRLERTRWPDEVEGADWDYGTNLSYLKELITYWRDKFDWHEQEKMLNQFAHFRAEVDGFGLHFIHERGKGPNPMPLLLLHGWPDSFYRFYKIIPMLTDPARFGGDPANSFDVIVPSLPGFGFSDRPSNRGGVDSAELFAKLMTNVLGYSHFGVHGGDGGSHFAQEMVRRYPEAVAAIHITDIGWAAISSIDPATFSPAEKAYMEKVQQESADESGYVMIQGSKPQTLAYGLNDSPAGLAAWIVEKFHSWSDSDGEIEQSFTKDELLTNIMIYWATETINTSIRGYYDAMHPQGEAAPPARIETPVGMALFPKDRPPPREMAERSLNVQHWTKMPHGGHFTALEAPEPLAEDLHAFFRRYLS